MIEHAILELVARFIAWTALLFALYVVIMRLKRKRDRGELRLTDWVVGVVVVPIGILADAFYNLTWASLFFFDPPREWLLTARLQRYRRTQPHRWRGRFAAWFCRVVLNPRDPGHC